MQSWLVQEIWMIAGIGTDIIEVQRINEKMQQDPGFKEALFTAAEISYCESKKFSSQHYAGRYAAKEGFFKALGTGWRYGMRYADIEILNDELGKPEIVLHNKAKEFCTKEGITTIHVSIAHTRDYATGFVVIEKH